MVENKVDMLGHLEILSYKKRNKPQPISSKLGVQVKYIFDNSTKKYRMYTDDLRYGDNLEVIFSNDKFVIKDYYKIKERWLKKHGRNPKDLDNIIKRSVNIL